MSDNKKEKLSPKEDILNNIGILGGAAGLYNMNDKMDYFSKKYDQSYLQYNGGSIMFASIITIVTASVVYYTYIIKDIKNIQDNWQEERCNLKNIPLAGIINPQTDGTSKSAYTTQNFSYCLNEITTDLADKAMSPFNAAINSIKGIFTIMMKAVQVIREYINGVRKQISEITARIYRIIITIVIEINRLVLKIKDTFSKVIGVVKASIFSTISVFFTLTSFMGAMMQMLIIALLTLFITATALAFIPFIGWGLSMIVFAFALLLSGTLIYIRVGAPKVFELMKYSVPSGSKPRCFVGDTIIKMKEGTYKRIKDIILGDVLKNNNKVTTLMKLTGNINNKNNKNNKNNDNVIYKLGDVFVTGCHKVKYKNTYINVLQHPDAEKLDREEEILYCINTTNKIIEIGDYEFLDYDEMIDDEYKKLEEYTLHTGRHVENIKFKMHEIFNGGFHENTFITMNNGERTKIKDIKVDDVLMDNVKVYGIVKIDNYHLQNIYRYNLGDNKYINCSKNILTYLSNNLNKISNLSKIKNIYNRDPYIGEIYNNRIDYSSKLVLYNLLTDKGYFKIEDIYVSDYDSLIDHYLEI